ncbi:MAG: hypothetical protein M3R00_07300, partial [Pseudomonadota bacterium]|nr:hypothetical protein [Pseudomonadota bacterium]
HLASISHDDNRIKAVTQFFLSLRTANKPALHVIKHADAITIMGLLIELHGDNAANLALQRDHARLTPFAHCCFTSNAELIASCATAFGTAETKLRAIRESIDPTRPRLNVIALHALCRFGESIASPFDCIDILTVLLQTNTPEEIALFPQTALIAAQEVTSTPKKITTLAPIAQLMRKTPSNLNEQITQHQLQKQAQILAHQKIRLVNHFLRFACPTAIYQNLTELINSGSRQLSFAFDTNDLNKAYATLLLATNMPIDEKAEEYKKICAENKESFIEILLRFYNVLAELQPGLNFQMTGQAFANPTLLREILRGTFMLLDDSIIAILSQYRHDNVNDIARLINHQEKNFLQVLLEKLSTNKYGWEFIEATVNKFGELGWLDATQLQSELSAILHPTCKSANASMLFYIDRQLDGNAITSVYPDAQNILHAFFLQCIKGKNLDRAKVCLSSLVQLLGKDTTTNYVQQKLLDGKIFMHIFAQHHKLFPLLAILEEHVGTTTLLGEVKLVFDVACQNLNNPLLIWAATNTYNPKIAQLAANHATLIHYICSSFEVLEFKNLCAMLGNANLKCLIDALQDNVLHLICQPRSNEGIANLRIVTSPWTELPTLTRISEIDENIRRKQSVLLRAVCKLYTPEEINTKALGSNGRNVMMLLCSAGNSGLFKQCLDLYTSHESRQQAMLQTNSITGVSILHIASGCCSTVIVRQILQILSERAEVLCLKTLENFGHLNVFHCCYLSAESNVRDEILQALCQRVSKQLPAAVIRPLSSQAESVVALSATQDKIIFNALLKHDLSSIHLAILNEIARGNVNREDNLTELSPRMRSPYQARALSPRRTSMGLNETLRRRGNTLPAG